MKIWQEKKQSQFQQTTMALFSFEYFVHKNAYFITYPQEVIMNNQMT